MIHWNNFNEGSVSLAFLENTPWDKRQNLNDAFRLGVWKAQFTDTIQKIPLANFKIPNWWVQKNNLKESTKDLFWEEVCKIDIILAGEARSGAEIKITKIEVLQSDTKNYG